jgi:hypothetical protein
MAVLTKVILATMGSEIVNHPPYSPDLATNDLYLFRPMKVLLGGQKLETDDELKYSAMNWLCS